MAKIQTSIVIFCDLAHASSNIIAVASRLLFFPSHAVCFSVITSIRSTRESIC